MKTQTSILVWSALGAAVGIALGIEWGASVLHWMACALAGGMVGALAHNPRDAVRLVRNQVFWVNTGMTVLAIVCIIVFLIPTFILVYWLRLDYAFLLVFGTLTALGSYWLVFMACYKDGHFRDPGYTFPATKILYFVWGRFVTFGLWSSIEDVTHGSTCEKLSFFVRVPLLLLMSLLAGVVPYVVMVSNILLALFVPIDAVLTMLLSLATVVRTSIALGAAMGTMIAASLRVSEYASPEVLYMIGVPAGSLVGLALYWLHGNLGASLEALYKRGGCYSEVH